MQNSDVANCEFTIKRKCHPPISKPKRLRVFCNTSSKPLKEFILPYIRENQFTRFDIREIFETTRKLPDFFAPSKDWEKRFIFKPDLSRSSSSGMPRIDLYVYAIEANTETNTQIAKRNRIHSRNLNYLSNDSTQNFGTNANVSTSTISLS